MIGLSALCAGSLLLFVMILIEVSHLRRGQLTLIANLKQLTQEIRKMDTDVLISAQALADLQAADASLKATVVNALTYISNKLGTVPADDSAQVEAVVSDVQAEIASLTAAITPPPPPAETSPAS